jgi:hypothetical protein
MTKSIAISGGPGPDRARASPQERRVLRLLDEGNMIRVSPGPRFQWTKPSRWQLGMKTVARLRDLGWIGLAEGPESIEFCKGQVFAITDTGRKIALRTLDNPDVVRVELEGFGLGDLEVGQILVYDYGYLRISHIGPDRHGDLAIHLESRRGGEWEHYGTCHAAEFREKKYYRLPASTVEEAEEEALKALQDPAALDLSVSVDVPNDETALVVSGGDEQARTLRKTLQNQIERVEALRLIVEHRVSGLRSVAHRMQEQMELVSKVLGAFELYLGVWETITQIRDGAPAPLETPVAIRQQILFMDEEVGDPRGGGIDWTRIEDFDAWIAQPGNLERLLPEQKGLVAMRPSRQERSYVDNPWLNMQLNANNQMVYLLCRNGDRLYRIWTNATMPKARKMYPGEQDRLADLADPEMSRWKREELEEWAFYYRRNVLLIQGLIDRTDIFKPMRHLVNLFDPTSYGDQVQLIRDAEVALPTGRKPYRQWHRDLNSNIVKGSRILVVSQWGSAKSRMKRYLRWYSKEWSVPDPPPTEVYTVEEVLPPVGEKKLYAGRSRTEEALVIRYNPKDRVYTDWGASAHVRRHRLSFVVYRSDWQVLFYDGISLDDVEFYIDSRVDRQHYLEMMPTLWGIRDQRLEEQALEREFVKLAAGRVGCPEAEVWSAIKWWKTEVVPVWKRPITKDDAKALRMIERRLRRT